MAYNMYLFHLCLVIYMLINCGVFGKLPTRSPCGIDDDRCLEVLGNNVLYDVHVGVPSLGIESSDPMKIDKFDANFATLKYTGCNNTITGLRKSSVKNIKVSKDYGMARFTFESPCLKLCGNIDVSGYLLYLPISGNGGYEINFGKQVIDVYCLVRQVKGKCGKIFVQLGDFTMNISTLGRSTLNLTDLYNKNIILTNEANELAEENWEETCYFEQEPLWYPIMSKLLKNCNKYLLSVPAEEIVHLPEHH